MASKKNADTTATASVFDSVKDNEKGTTASLVWAIMEGEATYAERVAHFGPIIAKRIEAGEKNADIARELVAIAKEKGHRLSQNAAAQKVRRYRMVGEAILSADKKADMGEVIETASAKARGAEKKGPKGPQTRRTLDERIAAWAEEGLALLRKAETVAHVEAMDTAATTLLEALGEAYALVEKAEAETDAA